MAGKIPNEIYTLISRIVGAQELVVEAGIERNIEKAFKAFLADPLVNLNIEDARKLFDEMVSNTSKYLSMYDFDMKK